MHSAVVAAVVILLALPAVPAEPVVTKLPVGSHRPRLDYTLLDGTSGPTWEDLGGRVVVMDFWATWCAPCVASIPHTNALQAQFKTEPVTFLSVTYEPGAKVRSFLAKHPMETRVAIDNDLATFKSFIAWGIPIAYVLDGSGTVIAAVSPRATCRRTSFEM